nr:hypothetical protein [Listeria valentina]
MEINEYKSWVVSFYKKRNWYHYDSFIRIGFLAEEVGEVLGNLFIIADKYDIEFNEILNYHKLKLEERFNERL